MSGYNNYITFETNLDKEALDSLKIGFLKFYYGQMCQLRSYMKNEMTKWSWQCGCNTLRLKPASFAELGKKILALVNMW